VAHIDFNKTCPEDRLGTWRDTVGKRRRRTPCVLQSR
jgi:hypothetical protein